MKRCLAVGWIIVAGGWALGQNPVSVHPQMAVPATSMVTAPLPMVMEQYAPITPTVAYPSTIAAGSCSTCDNRGTCAQRVWAWLTHQPGEPVVPFLQRANPYRAPLLAYFPCKAPRFPTHPTAIANSCSTCTQPSVVVMDEVPQQRGISVPLRDRLAFLLGYSPSAERVIAVGPSTSPFVMQGPIHAQPTMSQVQPVQYQMDASVPFSKR